MLKLVPMGQGILTVFFFSCIKNIIRTSSALIMKNLNKCWFLKSFIFSAISAWKEYMRIFIFRKLFPWRLPTRKQWSFSYTNIPIVMTHVWEYESSRNTPIYSSSIREYWPCVPRGSPGTQLSYQYRWLLTKKSTFQSSREERHISQFSREERRISRKKILNSTSFSDKYPIIHDFVRIQIENKLIFLLASFAQETSLWKVLYFPGRFRMSFPS